MEINLYHFENLIQWKSNVPLRPDNYVFAIVESGNISFKSNDTVYNLSPGDGIAFLPDKDYERIINEGKVKIHYFIYSSDYRLFPEGKVVFKDKDYIEKIIDKLNQVDNLKKIDKYSFKKALLWNIYILYITENSKDFDLMAKDPIIFETQKYLEEFFDNKISLEEVAKKYHLSYSQFFRRFKNAIGVSPTEFLFSFRLERAKTLLENTNSSIRSISNQCGFSDEFYFSKVFKREMKISPLKYRKSFKK